MTTRRQLCCLGDMHCLVLMWLFIAYIYSDTYHPSIQLGVIPHSLTQTSNARRHLTCGVMTMKRQRCHLCDRCTVWFHEYPLHMFRIQNLTIILISTRLSAPEQYYKSISWITAPTALFMSEASDYCIRSMARTLLLFHPVPSICLRVIQQIHFPDHPDNMDDCISFPAGSHGKFRPWSPLLHVLQRQVRDCMEGGEMS